MYILVADKAKVVLNCRPLEQYPFYGVHIVVPRYASDYLFTVHIEPHRPLSFSTLAMLKSSHLFCVHTGGTYSKIERYLHEHENESIGCERIQISCYTKHFAHSL